MYQTPTLDDFNRQIMALLVSTRQTAQAELNKLQAEYSRKGMGGSFIIAVGERFDRLHAEATDTAMRLIHEFVLDPVWLHRLSKQPHEAFSKTSLLSW